MAERPEECPHEQPAWAAALAVNFIAGDHVCCSRHPPGLRAERGGDFSIAACIKGRFLNGQVIYALAGKKESPFPTTESFGGVTNTWHVLRVLTCPGKSASKLV